MPVLGTVTNTIVMMQRLSPSCEAQAVKRFHHAPLRPSTKTMPKSELPVIQPPLPRASRWPYWVFVPLCALAYTVFCFVFIMFAWGLRGESKPWWYVVARVLAIPGVWLPPYIGAPLWGGIMGFGLVRLIRQIRGRRLPSVPPRL
jgi:hypothetical protein